MAQQVGQLSPDGAWLWNGSEWVRNLPSGAQSHPVAWARPYESPQYRSKFVTIFILTNIGALVVAILADVLEIALLAQGAVSVTESTIAQGLATASSILYYVTLVPGIVFFCLWLHRIVRNMPSLGSPDARWSPSGAVWRCFLPIFNLFHPLVGTRDAWRASDPSQRFLDLGRRFGLDIPLFFAGWWALWLLGPLTVDLGDGMTTSNDMQTFTLGIWIDGLGNLMLILSAGLAIRVVREITQRQDRKNELIASGQLA
jgi:Domain of unknown function (DUF4328)